MLTSCLMLAAPSPCEAQRLHFSQLASVFISPLAISPLSLLCMSSIFCSSCLENLKPGPLVLVGLVGAAVVVVVASVIGQRPGHSLQRSPSHSVPSGHGEQASPGVNGSLLESIGLLGLQKFPYRQITKNGFGLGAWHRLLLSLSEHVLQ